MIQSKLSNSTRIALMNNFSDSFKDNDGRVQAFLQVTKNIDAQLKNLGVWINPKSSPDASLFTIGFFPNTLSQLTEIDGVKYIDIGTTGIALETIKKQTESPQQLSKYVFTRDIKVRMPTQQVRFHDFKKGDIVDGFITVSGKGTLLRATAFGLNLQIPVDAVAPYSAGAGSPTPNASSSTIKSSINNIPTPVKALLGLAFILLLLKWQKII